MRHSVVVLALTITSLPCGASTERKPDALRFFEGSTESSSTIKVLMKRPYHSRSVGMGVIEDDGSLHLVQHVMDDGASPTTRRWVMRQVGQGHFSGTMSEAASPVDVEEIAGKYRFRFMMKGHLSAEEWIVPDAGGLSATIHLSVRKFGFAVATSEGVIRKIG